MELHQPDALFRAGEALRQRPRHVRLPGPRRPLKDHLPLVVEQCLNFAQELHRQQQPLGERHQICRLRYRWFNRFVTVRVLSFRLERR